LALLDIYLLITSAETLPPQFVFIHMEGNDLRYGYLFLNLFDVDPLNKLIRFAGEYLGGADTKR